jgi:tRNA threonylcarbamoyladenosine biosynthesis protein TsaE
MEWQWTKLEDADAIATELIATAGDRKVWCLEGQMGAGKTTLIAAFCKSLGVTESTGSPTYGLVNEYLGHGGQRICHFDFYRIQHLQEAYDMGAEEYFFSGDYCFIEWPERIVDLLPDHVVRLKIDIFEQSTRIIRILP